MLLKIIVFQIFFIFLIFLLKIFAKHVRQCRVTKYFYFLCFNFFYLPKKCGIVTNTSSLIFGFYFYFIFFLLTIRLNRLCNIIQGFCTLVLYFCFFFYKKREVINSLIWLKLKTQKYCNKYKK